jgi:WD40 repeat protein
MRIALVILFTFVFYYFETKNKISLPGKIAVVPVMSQAKAYSFYDNSDKIKFELKLRDDKGVEYGQLHWVHNVDNFIGVESLKTKNLGTSRSNVVQFDLQGNILDRIYESTEGEFTGLTFLSQNDNRLLFVSTIAPADPLEMLTVEESVIIMDFNEKKIIRKITNVGRSNSLVMKESPWVCDENRFIYTIEGGGSIMVQGRGYLPKEEKISGIYIYDLSTDQHQLLIPNGRLGVCSPVNQQISYAKGKSIWILDLKDNTKRKIYNVGSNGRIRNIHWTPDGKNIYLAYSKVYPFKIFVPEVRIVDQLFPVGRLLDWAQV